MLGIGPSCHSIGSADSVCLAGLADYIQVVVAIIVVVVVGVGVGVR